MTTKIEWCDETINPVVGCSKCSPGCDNCYAEKFAARLSKNPKTAAKYAGVVDDKGRWTGKISHLDLSVFDRLPKKPCSVFVGSMTDIFHENVPAETILQIFEKCIILHQHTFLFLTKRPERIPSETLLIPNAYLGVTVCSQKEADAKIPFLLNTRAAHRFLSIEPMLWPINLEPYLSYLFGATADIDCVIVGGETGPKARPMHPDWVRSVRDQCAEVGVPFFFKGWGEWLPVTDGLIAFQTQNKLKEFVVTHFDGGVSEQLTAKVGKKESGRLLDGVEHNERPW